MYPIRSLLNIFSVAKYNVFPIVHEKELFLLLGNWYTFHNIISVKKLPGEVEINLITLYPILSAVVYSAKVAFSTYILINFFIHFYFVGYFQYYYL